MHHNPIGILEHIMLHGFEYDLRNEMNKLHKQVGPKPVVGTRRADDLTFGIMFVRAEVTDESLDGKGYVVEFLFESDAGQAPGSGAVDHDFAGLMLRYEFA